MKIGEENGSAVKTGVGGEGEEEAGCRVPLAAW